MTTLLKRLDQKLMPQTERYRYSPYVWLAYLCFFFISFFAVPRPWHYYPLMVLGVVAFLALYFNIYWIAQDRVKYNITGIVAIGSLMAGMTEGASVFFVYAGAFCCMLGSPRKAVLGIVTILSWIMLLTQLMDLSRYFYLPAGIFTLFIGGINIYQHEIDKKDKQLQLSQKEIEQLAQTAERERIARDLHDLIGHTFSVLTLKADLAGKLLERDPQRARKEIKDIENTSRDALSQIREVVTGIRSADLDSELVSAKYLLQSNDIDFDYQMGELKISQTLNKELAVIVKELTTNIIKHAQASRVSATIAQDGKGLSLNVKDNGKGFAQEPKEGGFGLKGIRERLDKWQGSLTIDGTNGCEVRIFIADKQLEAA